MSEAAAPATVDPARIAAFLENVEMFRGLDLDARTKIARATAYDEFAAGHDIIRQGDAGDALYIIARGRVQVLVTDPQIGLEQPLATLEPTEPFGEMALLLDEPRTATVRALVDTSCVYLSREAFQRLLTVVPQVALTISRNLARRLSEQNRNLGFRFVRLSEQRFHADTYAAIPANVLERHQIVPLSAEAGTLTVAMTRPNDPSAVEAVRAAAPGMKLRIMACAEEDYRQFLLQVVRPGLGRTGPGQGIPAPVSQFKAAELTITEPESRVRRAPAAEVPGEQVVRLVNEIICDAINRGASDVHIEPGDHACRVRLRVDGRLLACRDDLPARFHAPLVSRIKILGDMDIAERRRPQDGRLGVRVGERAFDLRVNVLPTLHGEKIVMRVLDPEKSVQSLERLILSEPLAAVVRKAVFRPTGGVFICGPTGSGKTTTLYSALNERKQQANDLNIVTLEDPIEYTLEGVNQVQVEESAGMGFAAGLRALLRQDPNLIMVGEMRDVETARIALEAALTGHLVLSTLHTEGAVEAVTRLVEMGCAPYLVASAVDLVVAQRLMRRVCSQCATPHAYSEVVRHNLDRAGLVPFAESGGLVKGAGCDACHRTGYKGRIGAYEVLRVNDTLREAIGLGESESALRTLAIEQRTLTTFKQYAGFLLRAGHTSPSEALRLFSTE